MNGLGEGVRSEMRVTIKCGESRGRRLEGLEREEKLRVGVVLAIVED